MTRDLSAAAIVLGVLLQLAPARGADEAAITKAVAKGVA